MNIFTGSLNLAKKLVGFSSLLLFIATTSSAQTPVTGGIFSNTTWTLAGSPYIVTDTVKVYSGVTLTIQPGVIVRFNNSGLLTSIGNIIAIGTPTDSIVFTSNAGSPYAGIWNCINANNNFSYCRISYSTWGLNGFANQVSHCVFSSNLNAIYGGAQNVDNSIFKYDSVGTRLCANVTTSEFIHNGTGSNGSGNFTNCTFRNNTHGFSTSYGASTIAYCSFDSNNYGLYFPASDTIRNCSFRYNYMGIYVNGNSYFLSNDILNNYIGINTSDDNLVLNNISSNYIGVESNFDSLSCNTLCGNTGYNVILEGGLNTIARNNYWCLNDSAHIQATIYDAYQNVSLGFVYFTPFDTVPCSHLCSLSISASATRMSVCHDSTTLTANVSDANPVYSAVWNPGNHHGLSYTVSPSSDITYTVVVSDSSGCKDSAYITIDTLCGHICSLSLSAYATSPIVCSGDSSTLVANVIDTSSHTAVWNPGNFHGLNYTVNPTYDITYTVVVTDTYGCKDSTTVTVDTINCAPPPCGSAVPPSICFVTTDTSSTFNTVIWQKVGMDTLAIDSIIIYRENILDQYVAIGEVSVHAPTLYNDHTARPNIEPAFYELGIVDTCGPDANLSSYNETVFLQTSTGFGPHEANLSWNFYQGNPVLYYRILRDDSGRGNWHAIDSVNASINAYTDRSAPSNAGLRYMISTDWNVACTPFYAMRPHVVNPHYAFNRDGSYSNISYLYPTGVVSIFDNTSINVFPNPVNSTLFILFNQSFNGMVTITNVLGQQVYNNSNFTAEKGSTEQLNVSNLSSGVYIVTLQSSQGIVMKKIVKN